MVLDTKEDENDDEDKGLDGGGEDEVADNKMKMVQMPIGRKWWDEMIQMLAVEIELHLVKIGLGTGDNMKTVEIITVKI